MASFAQQNTPGRFQTRCRRASPLGTRFAITRELAVVRMPLVSYRSFSAMGIPCRGPRYSPRSIPPQPCAAGLCGNAGAKPRQHIRYLSAEINRLYSAPQPSRQYGRVRTTIIAGWAKATELAASAAWDGRAPRILADSMAPVSLVRRQRVWSKISHLGCL